MNGGAWECASTNQKVLTNNQTTFTCLRFLPKPSLSSPTTTDPRFSPFVSTKVSFWNYNITQDIGKW